jgi:hypothetical protein
MSFSSGPDNGNGKGTGGSDNGGMGGMTGGGTAGMDNGTGGTDNGTGGMTMGTGGSTIGMGGSNQPGMGGRTGTGGMTTAGMGGATGMGGSGTPVGPCDVLAAAGNNCVAAHSTTRVLLQKYTGPLYQVCKGASAAGPNSCPGGNVMDIPAVNGYANSMVQDTFCTGAACTISIVYDQSGMANHLHPAPAGGAKASADNPVIATDLKTSINGHIVYGMFFKNGSNMGYRAGCTGCAVVTPKGTATADAPETEYMITSQNGLFDGCCFDYGNAETDSRDDGNGTMEAVYFGGGVVWGTGSPGGHNNGPWVMGDLENGLYAGWENNQDQNISTNTPLRLAFITAAMVGDSCTGVAGCGTSPTAKAGGRFALYGGDATTGTLKTMYDGIRPQKTGYVPMKKQGSIILGIGGDNSDSNGGQFFEGVMATGAATIQTINQLQANIVAARYGK